MVRFTRYNPVMRKVEDRPDWQIALGITATLRVFYSVLAAVLSFVLRPSAALIHSNQLTENLPAVGSLRYAILDVWARFDTLWYMRIAEHGYDRPMAPIFYPLYPLAIRAVGWGRGDALGALLISTAAAFFFFWGVLQLAREEPRETRLRTLLFLIVWPTSFILFAGYAESLTLALVTWAVVFARVERWWPAAFCGLLAGASRPSGVLVAIPLFVLALRSRRFRSLPVILSPLGLISYWIWLRWTGHPSVVTAYQQQQGMTVVPPWQGAGEAIRLIVTHGDVILAIKLAMVIGFGYVVLRAQLDVADKLFAIAVILQMFMYTGRPLLGAARYLLLVYPAFIALGKISDHWHRRTFTVLALALACLNLAWMAAFLNWSLVL